MTLTYSIEEILEFKDSYKDNPFYYDIEIVPGVVVPQNYDSRNKKYRKNKRFPRNSSRYDASWPRAPVLKSGENAWKPTVKQESPDESDNSVKLKQVISILNKISADNFDSLVKNLLNINLTTSPTLLENVVKAIFEKALLEPNFGEIYAKLCVCFGNFNVKFKKELLISCQREFEKENIFEEVLQQEIEIKNNNDLSDYDKLVKLDDIKYKKIKIKNNMIGNVLFISQLFKSQMISETIIHKCLEKLFSSKKENDVECICKILETAGSRMKENLIPYFEILNNISSDKEHYDSRHRFMVKDIIELKDHKWIPRNRRKSLFNKSPTIYKPPAIRKSSNTKKVKWKSTTTYITENNTIIKSTEKVSIKFSSN